MFKKRVKITVGWLLYTLYFILNFVFVKKRKRVIFISFPDASDNSWHMYKYCLAELENYEIVWLVDSTVSSVVSKILNMAKEKTSTNKVKVIKRWSFSGFICFIDSRVVFHTHGTYFFIRKAINTPVIVNLWHGMPIKAIGFLDKKTKHDVCYSDYTIATSEMYRTIMSTAFGMPKSAVLSTGLPRNDVLYSGVSDFDKEKIFNAFFDGEITDFLIWLPTYRASAIGDIRSDGQNSNFIEDLSDNFLNKLNSLCKANKLSIVVKLHPMDSMNSSKEEFSLSNIKFYNSMNWENKNVDLYDLISLSKGLISDFSSVMIDCFSTSIPVAFIKSSQEKYTRDIVVPVDDLLSCVSIVNEPNDLIEMIKSQNANLNLIGSNNAADAIFNSFGTGASAKIIKILNLHHK